MEFPSKQRSTRDEVVAKTEEQLQEVCVSICVEEGAPAVQKTVYDVLGICCASEVALIHRILQPIPGVLEIYVNVPAKTTTVSYDPTVATDLQLVKALNEARLDARIHARGQVRVLQKWPRWNVLLCGAFLAISFIKYAYGPMKWVALASVAFGLPPILLKSISALHNLVLDINALMTIAVAGALALGDFEEAASVVFFFAIADWLEGRTSERARKTLEAVLSLAPDMAVLAESREVVPTSSVLVGTLLAVRAGEMIPVDGIVENGSSTVDESSLTGESVPVTKTAGSNVWAGTLNIGGFLRFTTTALATDSAVARMVRLVEDSQSARSASERLVERFARFYTPAVVLVAILVAVIPYAVGVHNPGHWVYLALVLLVVACPCALVISTPMVSVCGIAQAARNGVLIKGGAHLETLGKMKVLALDKTGTLTEGQFRVAQVLPVGEETDAKDVLFWLASVEALSGHPLARAVVSYARMQGVEASKEVSDFEILPGEGVTAVVEGRRVHVGNRRAAERFEWMAVFDASILELWMSEGGTVGWLGLDEQLIAVFSVADQPRREAGQAVQDLKSAGLRVVMLTGDNIGAATAIKNQVDGSMVVHSGLLPADKVTVLKGLKSGGVTGMVGDGINDAPALAAADVGIAMGVAGSAVAMETADMALMTNDLRQLTRAVLLARDCRSKILQNMALAIGSKVFVLVLAFTGYAALWLAVVADVGTSLVVSLNSLRVMQRGKGRSQGVPRVVGIGNGCCQSDQDLCKMGPEKASGCCSETSGSLGEAFRSVEPEKPSSCCSQSPGSQGEARKTVEPEKPSGCCSKPPVSQGEACISVGREKATGCCSETLGSLGEACRSVEPEKPSSCCSQSPGSQDEARKTVEPEKPSGCCSKPPVSQGEACISVGREKATGCCSETLGSLGEACTTVEPGKASGCCSETPGSVGEARRTSTPENASGCCSEMPASQFEACRNA